MRPLVKTTLTRVTLFLLCACVGGPLFWSIERQEDNEQAKKNALLQSLNKTMSIKYNITAQEFENFTKIAHEARTPAKPSWTIEDGFSFAFIMITTIGYGHITPVTKLGQAMCIFYGLIGIPITLLALKSTGELIAEGLSRLIRKFETRLLKREEVYHCEAKTAVTSFLFTVAMICLGAILAMITENWTFLEGSYFWFVSFSTIGFGDYIPKQTQDYIHDTERETERVGLEIALSLFYIVWYVLGLCMVSSLIGSIQAAYEGIRCPQSCRACFAHRRCRKIGGQINEESSSKRNPAYTVTSTL